MNEEYASVGSLHVSTVLYEFLENEVLPGSGVQSESFWSGFETLIKDLTPRNAELLAKRDALQELIDDWHRKHVGSFDAVEYKDFLKAIGYLAAEPEAFEIDVEHVDDEIATLAGPQLVVPVNNARYALNAVNARWGSLYDALYGTDAIPFEHDGAQREGYNPLRGAKVVAFSKAFLDQVVPLRNGSHANAINYSIRENAISVELADGSSTTLSDRSKFAGYLGDASSPSAILLKNNGLYIEVLIDRSHPVGAADSAGVKDIVMEAALTTIMDCEDSVAAVDAEDKVGVYRNWLGLMKGDLETKFIKDGKFITRSMQPDREFKAPNGKVLSLRGRSLLFVRNVGHLMTIAAVLDGNGQEVYEGILDGVVTSLIAKHTLNGNSRFPNTDKGSVYIVKPKMHGPEEVAFAGELFDRIEDMLDLPRNTLKIGVMDEERRTSLNLKACVHAVKNRIVFVNTGFLDRTGDEIHTSIEAGPMIRKNDMKSSTWLQSYERSNVLIGLASGMHGRAQIGKGMWAMPDKMHAMLQEKIAQPKGGANTAWVPSPTAATLHAIHYHEVDVSQVQRRMKLAYIDLQDGILALPVAENPTWSKEDIQQELENNAQSILGYVVRWVEAGIGCSKVPDIHNIGLMEDRATLRISSQHIANWLRHNICTKRQVLETLQRMARIVDAQNAGNSDYRPMSENFGQSLAFQAACDLVFEGSKQPNGYTEPILHRRRLEYKLTKQMKRK